MLVPNQEMIKSFSDMGISNLSLKTTTSNDRSVEYRISGNAEIDGKPYVDAFMGRIVCAAFPNCCGVINFSILNANEGLFGVKHSNKIMELTLKTVLSVYKSSYPYALYITSSNQHHIKKVVGSLGGKVVDSFENSNSGRTLEIHRMETKVYLERFYNQL